MRKNRGLGLAELVLSFFLLAAGTMVVAQLFQTSLRRNVDSGLAARAALIAHARLAEIRAWASSASGGAYNFDDWAPYLNSTAADPDEPAFSVNVRSADQPTGSLSTQLESAQTEKCTLTRSLRKVEITVTWSGTQSYRLVSLVGDPLRQLAANPVQVQAAGATGSLAAGATVNYQAALLDSNGDPIPDVGFKWLVEPGTGDGTLEWIHRDQRTSRFINRYTLKDGTTTQVPGTCWVRASTSYAGLSSTGLGPQMVLLP